MGDGQIISELYQGSVKRQDRSKRRKDVAVFLYILLGSLIIAISINTFAEQGGLMPGDFIGLARLIQGIRLSFYDVQISFILLNVLFNAVPAVLAYRLVDRKFAILSCICLLITPILMDKLPVVPIIGGILLVPVLGGIIDGLGMDLVLNSRACGGGTGFIATSLSTEHRVSTFNHMLLFDAVIILVSGTIFGIGKALHSIIFQFYNTRVISTFYEEYEKKALLIMTDNSAAMSTDLLELTNHSNAILKGFNSYSANRKYLIYAVLLGSDVRRIRKQIREQYPSTFVNVINSNDVVGNFYIQSLERSALSGGSAS